MQNKQLSEPGDTISKHIRSSELKAKVCGIYCNAAEKQHQNIAQAISRLLTSECIN